MSNRERRITRHAAEVARAQLARGVEHAVPIGARNDFSRSVYALVAQAGEDVREDLAKPENVRAYLDSLMSGVKGRDRTCMRLYAQVMKLVDAEKELILMVLRDSGMASMDELSALVASHREAAGVSAEQRFAVCMEYAGIYLDSHPEARVGAIRLLGGEVAQAEVVGGASTRCCWRRGGWRRRGGTR